MDKKINKTDFIVDKTLDYTELIKDASLTKNYGYTISFDYVLPYILELGGDLKSFCMYSYLLQKTVGRQEKTWSITDKELGSKLGVSTDVVKARREWLHEHELICFNLGRRGQKTQYSAYPIVPKNYKHKKTSNTAMSDGQHELCTEVF